MPQVYLGNDLYKRVVEAGREPGDYVNEAVREKLDRDEKRGKR